MVRRPLVAANWKMHGQKAQVDTLAKAFVAALAGESRVDVLVCPAFVFLPQLQAAFGGTSLKLGGQNLHQEAQGAFTGEVSGSMLKDCGCTHVIVGHSERRQQFGESDELVALKFAAALQADLIPLLCVGETADQRKAELTAEVVRNQLGAVISACGIEALSKAVIAYEPVWAIGTGVTATPEQAQEVHVLIRQELARRGSRNAQDINLLYGGSVRAANANELFLQPDIDGALVGGASLSEVEFVAICKAAAGI